MTVSDELATKFACIELCNAFAYCLDRGAFEDLAGLFTPDGVWVRHGVELHGRQAILEAMSQRPPDALTRHVTTGHHFLSVTADKAEAVSSNRSYFASAKGDLPRSLLAGEIILLDFIDTFVRRPEGWRIARRETNYVMVPDAVRAHFVPGGN